MDKDQRVKQAFDAWQDRRAVLQKHSQLLESALKLYSEGSGPMPADLMDEVHGLRRECDALFKEVLAAVADRGAGAP